MYNTWKESKPNKLQSLIIIQNQLVFCNVPQLSWPELDTNMSI